MAVERKGARNPKVTRVTVRLAVRLDERLEAFADMAGLNKGTAAAVCLTMGLNFMERGLNPTVDPREMAASIGQDIDDLARVAGLSPEDVA